MTEKRFRVEKQIFDGYCIVDSNDEGYYAYEKQDLEKLCENLNDLNEENEQLKESKKGQELEIVRLHHLADAMSGALRELGIYDVYNKKQIDKVKKELEE